MQKKSHFFRNLINQIWLLFLSGLFTILPITLTVALFGVSFNLLIKWLKPLKTLLNPTIISTIPYAEIILMVLFIFLIGIITKVFILKKIIHTIENFIVHLPLIRPIYKGIKQLVDALTLQDKITFKHVVSVEFPRDGVYSIGFLTSELSPEFSPDKRTKFVNVFIPTTPNPTSGFLVLVPETKIHIMDITRQDAMAMIISGGIIQPERK